MKRVAVLGGGPAGSVAAARLAEAGLDTILLDEKLAWEKPCGGGITWKAYSQYPFLIDNDAPRKVIRRTLLTETRAGTATLELTEPLLIYARKDLNGMLLERAARMGARIEKERALSLERRNGGWRVRTRCGAIEADYLIVATGARNSLREVGTQYTARDSMCALGYYVPVEQNHVEIQFFPGFEGYIWVFPRCGHLSAGICGKNQASAAMRQRLEDWMDERGISRRDAVFYGHMIPALERPSWRSNRVSGEGWAAVGDAAGLVDPVTGEGIYYAVRSGDLAAQTLLDEAHAPSAKHAVYRSLLHQDFIEDLAFAAGLAKRFFLQQVLMSSVPGRMIEFMRRSPSMTAIVQDLFAGTQNYLALKSRLLNSLNGTMLEAVMGAILSRRVVKEGEA
ncbi:MAG: NAD(P)/FAD-dependent oxidoreductase [Bryobacteraceae bacterium]|nr:NAD(P)/FAD-dependent oxidoreductase [Bryobacteraceae bacterium]